jgi:phage-related protein
VSDRRFQAVYYRAADGSQPVDDFIESLDPRAQAVLDQQIERLNLLGPSRPHLPFPHSSQIDGELRELRCHFGSSLYRVLYRRSGNLIVLLHMFRKDTGQVPSGRSRSPGRALRTFAPAWTRRAAGRLARRVGMRRRPTYQVW